MWRALLRAAIKPSECVSCVPVTAKYVQTTHSRRSPSPVELHQGIGGPRAFRASAEAAIFRQNAGIDSQQGMHPVVEKLDRLVSSGEGQSLSDQRIAALRAPKAGPNVERMRKD